MYRAMSKSSLKSFKQSEIDSSILEVEESTDDFITEDGKRIRWRRIFEATEP